MKAFEAVSKGRESEGVYACELMAADAARELYIGSVVEVEVPREEYHLIDTRLHPSLWVDY